RQQVMDIDFSSEKTLFLNDVAVKDAHTLFVSATDLGKIFQVRLSPVKPHFQALALKEEIRGPNGLLYQPATKSLFVVGFGKDNQPNGQVGVVYMQRGVSYEILSDVQGLLDGVALVSHSQLLFSDWVAFEKKGELKSFNLKTKEIKTLDLGDKIAGPADFYYQPSSRKIWIPEMMAGKILIEDLPQ
ncbi:MAG: hypothetical protein HYS07_00655, partial [Chlamydiae bacterium]|nr:hypothetical protein [Chlamydiota bacterium]